MIGGTGALAANQSEAVYGRQLLLRLSMVQRKDVLSSPEALERFLESLVTRIGMRVLCGPYSGTEMADGWRHGHSAIVVLQESHAAVHAYPSLGEAFIDVFSCRDYSIDDVVAYCREALGDLVIAEIMSLVRGFGWSDVTAE